MSEPIDIIGLRVEKRLPTCEMLVIGLFNDTHINHIELARYQFLKFRDEGKVFDGIMLVFGENDCSIYNFK